jgi:hypothetical protein
VPGHERVDQRVDTARLVVKRLVSKRACSASMVAGAIADIFDALVSTLSDTRLQPDLEDLLWSTVNLFHPAVERIERKLDDNEQAQRKS